MVPRGWGGGGRGSFGDRSSQGTVPGGGGVVFTVVPLSTQRAVAPLRLTPASPAHPLPCPSLSPCPCLPQAEHW